MTSEARHINVGTRTSFSWMLARLRGSPDWCQDLMKKNAHAWVWAGCPITCFCAAFCFPQASSSLCTSLFCLPNKLTLEGRGKGYARFSLQNPSSGP